MWQLQNSAQRRMRLPLLCAFMICCTISAWCVATLPVVSSKGPAGSEPTDKPAASPTLRWDEQQPGCTFSRGDDGRYRYGIWSGDVGMVLAVDAREMQIMRHRIEPILGVLRTIRYRGTASRDAGADGITLQFMKHFKVSQPALDPDGYIQKIQSDSDMFDDETRRDIKKHPEEKQAR